VINAIGFAPHPPLLVPEVASGAAVELDDLRVACDQLVADLVSSSDSMILLGSGQGIELGRWLLRRNDWSGPLVELVAPEHGEPLPDHIAAAIASEDRVAVLAMGDGSACRTEKAPGYLDDRSIDFDNSVADALTAVDAATLMNLDQQLATELLVAGRYVWPIAARIVETDSGNWRGELRYRDDPYGVSYFVALWTSVGIPSTTGP